MTRSFAWRLAGEREGSVAVEFAVLGPAFLVLLFGIFQVGIGMQNYNALRNASADVARHAMVQYATGNKLSEAQLRSYAISVARSSPYLLKPSQLSAEVDTPGTQRVAGASEMTLTFNYQIESVLSGFGLEGPYIRYTRPIFVTT